MAEQAVTMTALDEATQKPVNIRLTLVEGEVAEIESYSAEVAFAAPRGFLPDEYRRDG